MSYRVLKSHPCEVLLPDGESVGWCQHDHVIDVDRLDGMTGHTPWTIEARLVNLADLSADGPVVVIDGKVAGLEAVAERYVFDSEAPATPDEDDARFVLGVIEGLTVAAREVVDRG